MGLKIKITKNLYYSGKFQIFYQKAAVMDTLVLKPCPLRLYAPLRIHPSGSGLLLVKFWNCQSHITCEISNFQTRPNRNITQFQIFFIINIKSSTWHTIIAGMPHTKYQCFVLCLQSLIPRNVPALPPIRANVNRVFSEILHSFLFAFFLSNHIA